MKFLRTRGGKVLVSIKGSVGVKSGVCIFDLDRWLAHAPYSPKVIVTCYTAADSDESYINCQTHAAREVAIVLSGRGPTTEIKYPWLLAEAQDEGFGERKLSGE